VAGAAGREPATRADATPLDLTHDRSGGRRDRFPHTAEQGGPGWESALDALGAVGW